MRYLYLTLIAVIMFNQNFSFADEIIQDVNGHYFLIKDDGTFVKLPPPKPGHKYIIQKKKIKKKIEKTKIFKKPEKKARRRTNQGIR